MNHEKAYINIFVSLPEESFEIAYGFISNYPITGIEEKIDEIIITIPEILWNDTVKRMLIEDLNKTSPDAKIIKEEIIYDKNWNEEWEKSISAIIINDRIAITPEWAIDQITNDIKLVINPKMSFGTGHHATTRMMCTFLENSVKLGSKWIDAGTGTGVLGILAIKLGASYVFAFDFDEWSIENTKENLALNNITTEIDLKLASILDIELPECDGIAANMYTHLLTPSFSKFKKALENTNGDLIISGVLIYDKSDIIKAAEKAGFVHIETMNVDEWIAVHFRA